MRNNATGGAMFAQMLIPFLLVAVGIWRWRELSKDGEIGFLIGFAVFSLCTMAAVCFGLGVIACGIHC
jgi:hypothetical protein